MRYHRSTKCFNTGRWVELKHLQEWVNGAVRLSVFQQWSATPLTESGFFEVYFVFFCFSVSTGHMQDTRNTVKITKRICMLLPTYNELNFMSIPAYVCV